MPQDPTDTSLTTLPFDVDIFLDKWKFGWGPGTEEHEARERELMCRDLMILLTGRIRGERVPRRTAEQARSSASLVQTKAVPSSGADAAAMNAGPPRASG